jgi:hypothetical protein
MEGGLVRVSKIIGRGGVEGFLPTTCGMHIESLARNKDTRVVCVCINIYIYIICVCEREIERDEHQREFSLLLL